MTQNKKIAVTGGIGSGKSAFCAILKKRGYPVFSCDEINAGLWENGEYVAGIRAMFPSCQTKREVARLVFSDEDARRKLNAYAHPRIMAELLRRMGEEGLCFAEVPLLFEGGFEGMFDGVIALYRNKEERIAAAAQRDRLSEEEIAARAETQFNPEELRRKGCIVVVNDGDLRSLEQKADEVLVRLGGKK